MEDKKHFALYMASLTRGGSERVITDLGVWLYEHGHRVTFVTTYLGFQEYEVRHAAWRVLSAEEAQGMGEKARRVMYTDESIAYVDPAGGEGTQEDDERGGIARVFSGLMPEQQSIARATNLAKRSSLLHQVWEDLKPDLILSFIGKNNIMALMTTIGMDVPVVVSSRGNPSSEYSTRQLHLSMVSTFRRAAGVVVQTQAFANYYPAGIKEKCKVIPNAISEAFLRPPYEGEREQTIVAVGSLYRVKNHALLLKAFARVMPKHPEWKLIIYGEGIERKRLTTLINSLGIRTNVSMPGQVADVADKIYKAGMFVLTSDEEGMPNALIEAMSLGLPCITTDFAGGAARELVKDGFNGLVVPAGDVGRLETALIRIMDNNGFANALGTKASDLRKTNHPDTIYAEWESYLIKRANKEEEDENPQSKLDILKKWTERR